MSVCVQMELEGLENYRELEENRRWEFGVIFWVAWMLVPIT